MIQKPSIPKGTRDFSPIEMVKRNYIFDTIKNIFLKYGFSQIETPAMENLSTLMGKYGDEGDRLIFKILNSGNFLSKLDKELIEEKASIKISNQISEKGLRYDLTVPFARYVVQHRNDIIFPFKRYQIQPVWRADKPQKGRYREFFQCDVDVVGSNSLLNEVELIQIIDDVFNSLQINSIIKINNRKILTGIAEIIGEIDKIIAITVAIDKINKIGIDKVNEELTAKGLTKQAIKNLQPILNLSGNNFEKLKQLKNILKTSEIGLQGISEMESILAYFKDITIKNSLEFDLTLARGLNYYTGSIFEVQAKDVNIGSVCGGGRYDDLTGIFGLKDISGVGISFGADRIYDVLKQLDKFPKDKQNTTKLLFINFGEKEEKHCLSLISQIRKSGINTEIYPDNSKIKKQMNYANNKNIPFVALIGENELIDGSITLKDMKTGKQEKLEILNLINKLLL